MTITDVPTTDVPDTDRLAVLEAKIDVLAEQMAFLTAEAEVRRYQREAIDDLTSDLSRVSHDAMAMLTDRLAEAERKGYFDVARAAAGVADRVVDNFDEDDLEQLGDNVVTILDAVKEITQPEMLDMLHRMVGAVRAEQRAVELEGDEAPSFWALAKQARDPDVRRGMSRALHTLRTVSVETGPRPNESNPPTPPQGVTT